jgi:lipopolysaccharide biosynthesis glycosyltransferase
MDILTSAEGRYIQAAEAMLFSFLSHNPGPHTIYLLSQEAPSRFRDIARLCDLAGAGFNLLNPNLHVRGMRDASSAIKGAKNVATYHRIYAGQLLPPEVCRILYLDADLLVRTSIAELWSVDLANYYLAASAMTSAVKNPDFAAKFGGRYFNAGVMLINLDRWRLDNISGECERVLVERSGDIIFMDQCLLNFTCRPWLEIGINYNFTYSVGERWAKQLGLSRREFRAIAKHPSIIHFVGPKKPWRKDPASLNELELEYSVYRHAFEGAVADQRWTGLSIHQEQAQERQAKRKARRRAERLQAQAEQARIERQAKRRAGRRAERLQAQAEQARIERQAKRRAGRRAERLHARAEQARAERQAKRKARRRAERLQAQAEQARVERRAKRRPGRRAERLQARAEQARIEKQAKRRAGRRAERLHAQAEQARIERQAKRKARRRAEAKARARANELGRGSPPWPVAWGAEPGNRMGR